MSELYLRAENNGGRTVISDSRFTSPIKIAKPFYRDDHTEVMMMTASAGILEGDRYDIGISAGKDTALKFTGQSYTKIFKAEKSGASQRIDISAEEGAKLLYMPCPVIPFGQSVFNSQTEIHLAENSRFAMCDILSCGRAAMNESFKFSSYRSRTAVYIGEKLKFLDNVRLAPEEAELSGIGFFEKHTHMGMLYVYGFDIDELPEFDRIEAAVTKAESGVCIRIAADSADEIVRFAEKALDGFFN
ncbi:MAG: urease accessory protein UreD [Oscillospiraceae bacterium]